ncbi:MAG: hypothetical protein WC595_02825 [Candidatus Nanoarchaeia archaeon]
MKEYKEGWQCFVEIEGNKVIKRLKTKEEVSKKVKEYLMFKNSLELLEERTEKVYSAIKNSLEVVKESGIPKVYLANAEINNNIIKQDKVVPIGDKISGLLNENRREEAEKLIITLASFILELWRYKIHEYNYKFYSNYGLDNNGNIVLIDFLEITNDKEKVRRHIISKKWDNPERYLHKIDIEIANLFVRILNKNLTLDNLEKNWGGKCSN